VKKKATQAWCEVFLEKLKTLDEPVTFKELKNLVWDDPEARPSTASKKSFRYKMTNMPVTGHTWGVFCKRFDDIIVTRKVSNYHKALNLELVGPRLRLEKTTHYEHKPNEEIYITRADGSTLKSGEYEAWTVTHNDENNRMLSQEQYEYEEHALATYHDMVCECLPNHGVVLTHHTDWRMIDDEYLPKSWATVAHFKKDCQHIDFTDTLDGAVCNDCQTEVGE